MELVGSDSTESVEKKKTLNSKVTKTFENADDQQQSCTHWMIFVKYKTTTILRRLLEF